jgi:hypothetical protein
MIEDGMKVRYYIFLIAVVAKMEKIPSFHQE